MNNLTKHPQFIGSQQTHHKRRLHRIELQEDRENTVLKIKEREETIQLLAMDAQVYGELLTHHRKGSKVDVEALRDRFPLRLSTGKGLQMGSRKNRNLQRRKKGFRWLSIGFPIFENLQKWDQVGRSHMGPTRQQGTPWEGRRALMPCGPHVAPSDLIPLL